MNDWRRLHPLTPLLRGGRYGWAVLLVLTQQGLQQRPSLGEAVLAITAVGAVGVFFGFLSWRATRYRVAEGDLQIDSGIFQRRSRRVPLARVQSVDVVRPPLARVLGLSELRLEVAGGTETEAPLAFLSDAEAQALRIRLLDQSPSGAGTRPAAAAPEVPVDPAELLLVRVPTSALVVSVLLSSLTLFLALLTGTFVVLLVVAPAAAPAVLAAALPALLGTGAVFVRRLLGEYGFSVSESADGLRIRHGLLETRSQTIPPGRVQSLRLHEPLLWRRRDWIRVEVDVAGYSSRGQDQAEVAVLLPVAPHAFALAMVERVLGRPLPPADRHAPARARWRAPLSSRLLAAGLDDHLVVAVSGVLTRTTEIVPLAKVQSLRLRQGPWERRLDLASLHVDSAGRQLPGAVLRHRDAAEAAGLLADLTRRSRAERRSVGLRSKAPSAKGA
ncbi:MAG: Bacterial rane flanked domain protein, partial [Frankiales bacterium]|nr:Bacterial rane flanked domain protein [Frankiales bacterium]